MLVYCREAEMTERGLLDLDGVTGTPPGASMPSPFPHLGNIGLCGWANAIAFDCICNAAEPLFRANLRSPKGVTNESTAAHSFGGPVRRGGLGIPRPFSLIASSLGAQFES